MANDVFKFTQGEEEYTIVMYSGIMNKITQVIGGIDGVDGFLTNPEQQDTVVKLLLTKYKDDGTADGFIYPPFKVSNEVRKNLTVWVYESVTDFLFDMINQAKPILEKIRKKTSEVTKIG